MIAVICKNGNLILSARDIISQSDRGTAIGGERLSELVNIQKNMNRSKICQMHETTYRGFKRCTYIIIGNI